MNNHHAARPRIAQTIRWLSVPILLFWLAVAVISNALVPQLEEVGKAHNVALSSPDAASLQAFKHIGKVFGEFDYDSAAMIVLESDKPLGADAHRFYDTLVQRISQDHTHVQHIQDFWVARRCPLSPSMRFATSWTTRHPRRGSRLTSPARRPRSPINSRWAAREP
jgi:uncharacterized membrane protein YdfJ with MMPL/SSD domain